MLSKLISQNDIKINLESTEKEECFAELLEVMVKKQPQINRSRALTALFDREEKRSTAVFPHVAVPHAVDKSLNNTAIAIGITRRGIEFEKCDNDNFGSEYSSQKNPIVNIVFEVLFEESDTSSHLYVLKDILNLVQNPEFINDVLSCNSATEVYDLIISLEN